MKKRDISKLDGYDILNIESWLEKDLHKFRCPFYNSNDIMKCKKCADIFPRIQRLSDKRATGCPCNTFPVKYVKQVARKTIKEWREK